MRAIFKGSTLTKNAYENYRRQNRLLFLKNWLKKQGKKEYNLPYIVNLIGQPRGVQTFRSESCQKG